jgi:branched-chain amino acid transport system permease protein
MISHWLYLFASVLELSLMAQATDLLSGHAGRLGFGAVISAGIGAYSYALLCGFGWNPWLGIFVALLVGGCTGLGLFVLVIKLNGDAYLLASFGLQMALVEMANNLSITGGPLGLRNIPIPRLWIKNADSDIVAILVLLGAAIIAMLVLSTAVGSSRGLGRMVHWIRDDYLSAITAGINPNVLLGAVCVVHSLIGACAGVGLVISQGYIGPESFDLWLSLNVLTIVILSGTGGHPALMLLGSFFIVTLNETVNIFLADPSSVGPLQQVLINSILIAFLALRRRGLAGPLLAMGPSSGAE